MGMVMDMSSYRQEISESDMESAESTIWSASRTSGLALNTLHASQAAKTLQASKMPFDLTTLDAELFLQRIYTYQR